MDRRLKKPETEQFFEELNVDYRSGKGKWADYYETDSPDLKGWEKKYEVFYCMAKTLEDMKFRQARENDPVGWEFPIYDHIIMLKDRSGEPIFGFTPYHSRCIIGFMPPWMKLSKHSIYMREGTIWTAARDVPDVYDEEMAIRLMKMPPLDADYGIDHEDILKIRAFNLAHMGTGPYAVDMESLAKLEEK